MKERVGILNNIQLLGNMWFSEIKPVTFESKNTDERLKEFYRYIGCEWVEIAHIQIDGTRYLMYFDEEGKIKGPWHPTYPLRGQDGEIYDVVAGSVLVVKEDENENILSLTEQEQSAIRAHLAAEMMAARKKVDEILAERRAKACLN